MDIHKTILLSLIFACGIRTFGAELGSGDANDALPRENSEPRLLPVNTNSVGIIQIESGLKKLEYSVCNATAWRDDYIITASHCVPKGEIIKRIKTRFVDSKGQEVRLTCKAKPMRVNRILEYAIIECPNLKKSIQAATVSQKDLAIGDDLILATFDVDELPKGLRVESGAYMEKGHACLPMGVAETFKVQTYGMSGAMSDHGNSASPVYERTEKGGGLIGFVLGGPGDDTKTADILPVGLILEDLKQHASHLLNRSVAVDQISRPKTLVSCTQ